MKSSLYLTISELAHLFPDISFLIKGTSYHLLKGTCSVSFSWLSFGGLAARRREQGEGRAPGHVPGAWCLARCFTSTVSSMSLSLWILILQSIK